MAQDVTLTSKDVQQASAAVAEASSALAALALDVLSRQGEAHLLFAGRDYVEARAKEHGVDASDAKLGALDVLALLRDGPTAAREFATLAALAVRGLAAHADDASRLARFVRHADWLELSTPYAPYAFVGPVLGDDATKVWDAVEEASKALGDAPRDAALRALHDATLTRAGRTHTAPVKDAEVAVEGELRSPPPSGFVGFLRLVSGFALLQWLVRFLAFLVGMRRRGVLSFEGGGLRLRKTVTVLGRTVREHDERFTLAAVASAARSARHPALGLLVGACCFALGILVGGLFLVEGVRSGETFLLLFGAGLVLAGGALDLGLATLLPGRRAQRGLELAVMPKRRFGLVGVDESRAESFVTELERRLPRR